ncbi:MAG: hypothetical protein P4L85_15875 [Paludisphaera borealis]|uniref:hypothetical protein n=1 Tax=Paludisphaera borealis TaxID=1387353 RepID=UPI0028480692|nr:hypothetical protein [Paludisphaera borealis]MDR3620830.1 hypothetical protein [Paludisphaera borealis]
MRIAQYVFAAAGNLVSKGCVVVVATALVSLMASLDGDVGGSDSPRGEPWTVGSAPQCDTTRVKMGVNAGRPFSFYSLEDEEGNEMVRVGYSRPGVVVINLGESFPARPGCSATVGGNYNFEVAHRGNFYRIRLRPDGTSGFTVSGAGGVSDGLGFTPEGKLVHGPTVLD